jgi:hypothetical protein
VHAGDQGRGRLPTADLVTTVCPGCTDRAMDDYVAGKLERDPFTGQVILEDVFGERQ